MNSVNQDRLVALRLDLFTCQSVKLLFESGYG